MVYVCFLQRGGDILEEQPLTNDDVPIIISTCIDFIEQHGQFSLKTFLFWFTIFHKLLNNLNIFREVRAKRV